jgi:hypothetical protein
MSPDIVFEESRLEYLLDLFDKDVDREGYIVDPETDRRVTPQNSDDPIKAEELGVVGHSSEIFVEDEVESIIEFVNSQKDTNN